MNLGEFFTCSNWNPVSETPHYGILGLLAGTASVTRAGDGRSPCRWAWGRRCTSRSFPRRKLKEFLKIAIEMLAAIPSIVWGFIAYMILNPLIIAVTGAPVGVNILERAASSWR